MAHAAYDNQLKLLKGLPQGCRMKSIASMILQSAPSFLQATEERPPPAHNSISSFLERDLLLQTNGLKGVSHEADMLESHGTQHRTTNLTDQMMVDNDCENSSNASYGTESSTAQRPLETMLYPLNPSAPSVKYYSSSNWKLATILPTDLQMREIWKPPLSVPPAPGGGE
ncbi:hypothetical protein DFJ73DRAFT_809552 [Zopfochytrium polystomum]|nr:hypothetical protein DFJ73DRAFT_809552 [Zopfochytrium polystomum]